MPRNSLFKGIIGTDFLKKQAITIDFNSSKIKFKDQEFPFKNSENLIDTSNINYLNEQHQESVASFQVLEQVPKNFETYIVAESVGTNVKLQQAVNIQHDTIVQDNKKTLFVKSVRKIVIPPKEKVYLEAKTEFNSNLSEFFFEPTIKNKEVEIKPSMHTVHSDEENKLNSNNDLNSEKGQIHDSNLSKVNFFVVVENISEQPFHINKNRIIGEIQEYDSFTEIEKHDGNQQHANINLIQADEKIRQLRENEFNIENFNLSHLQDKEKDELCKLLFSHKQAFASSLAALGHTDLVVPELTLSSEYPRRSPPFPIPQALLKTTKEQLDDMLNAGIISKTISDWSSPLLLVKKKPGPDGKVNYRLALDLRLINSIVTQSAYPLPKINDILSNIAQFKFFSNLDLQAAYHQIQLPEQYRPILSFNTPFGAYCYNRLVFGLKNSASYFQHLIDKIVDEVNLPGIFAYQDDIVVAANSFDETKIKLNKLLECFEKHNLTLSPGKCNFHNQKINYLGFQVSEKLIKPISSNITKITAFPMPSTKKQMKKFLGLCGFYRQLIPNFAHLTAGLNDITTNKAIFKITPDLKEAFNQLQSIFFKAPFLRQPDFNQPFFLNTDASSVAISACLSQKFNGVLLPVSYFSRTLNKHEKNYPALKLELLAIVKGILAFHYYLYGRKFTLLSDSAPLRHYRHISSPTDLTTRWLLSISEYQFDFHHIKGKENVLPDYLSRIPENLPKQDINSNPELLATNEILPTEEVCHHHVICNHNVQNCSIHHIQNSKQDPLLEISLDTFRSHQQNDKNISNICKSLQQNKAYNRKKGYFISQQNGLLYKTIKCPETNFSDSVSSKLVVPPTLVPKVLRIAHVTHYGVAKTYEQIQRSYYWVGAYRDTKSFVDSCQVCLQAKHHNIPQAPFQKTFVPVHPGEMVSMDLVGPFQNRMHILTIIDIFSRHLELYVVNNITANNIAEKFMKYISTHGRPAQVLSDLGTQFTAEIFHHINNILHINIMHTTVAHPQANSISERINSSIKATIKALQIEGKSFFHAVDLHKSIYNASKHPATKFTPNQVHFARNLSIFTDTLDFSKIPQNYSTDFKLFQILQAMEKVYDMVYGNLQYSQSLNQARQKSSKKLRTFQPEDMVYIRAPGAFKQKIDGPFKIIKQLGPVNYLVQRLGNSNLRKCKIHVDRLLLARKRPDYLVEGQTSECLGYSVKSCNSVTNNVSLQDSRTETSTKFSPRVEEAEDDVPIFRLAGPQSSSVGSERCSVEKEIPVPEGSSSCALMDVSLCEVPTPPEISPLDDPLPPRLSSEVQDLTPPDEDEVQNLAPPVLVRQCGDLLSTQSRLQEKDGKTTSCVSGSLPLKGDYHLRTRKIFPQGSIKRSLRGQK